MDKKERLLHRLDEISLSLKKTNKARAVLAFGSVGVETDRMDEYSDLDFLVVAEDNNRRELIEKMDWLSVAPVVYIHKNAEDGFKVFFEDGIYSEFGIVEEKRVDKIPHGEGRILWCEENFNRDLRLATKECDYDNICTEYALGELLTNLYVGLCRYARGEKLSALRFIQGSALDHLLSCSPGITKECSFYKDTFQNERRYEMRYPELAEQLPNLLQGYEKCPESALAILNLADAYFTVDPFVRKQITALADKIIRNREVFAS